MHAGPWIHRGTIKNLRTCGQSVAEPRNGVHARERTADWYPPVGAAGVTVWCRDANARARRAR
ncbi:hypothetical protein SCATT_p01850 (plasmid) [Streptantibioticus cattleyicolor NRRL 8057 = DSM 46488]|uniref:Uncharacterized protein n=1 Tax=Streptantibioticus cattleyicolor (strain ATCC 35852 / DSM 46488 / JCM 4925 / NBRC 14057 / NRRL 8057) TaxID=1003195 RepID=G8XEJ5_STREN|nr:hypothetical protein SCATT_p01850 [Streptantibioticus cattleyicolor NRRL 8057 = DSM 46488]